MFQCLNSFDESAAAFGVSVRKESNMSGIPEKEMVVITKWDLWVLLMAAAEWLEEHPDSLNAPAVEKALKQTKDFVK